LQAQIAELESQIQSLQEQESQKQQAPSENLQEQVQEVQEKNQEQQEQIEALQEQVQALQNEPESATEPTPALPTYVPKSKDEAILHELYQEGVRYITKPELKALGFNTGFWSNLTVRGAKYGKYELKKRFSDKVFNIVKLA
jgi:seryl-tRNA synthetase